MENRWALTNEATQRSLERVFERDRIEFREVGFYDSSEFLRREQHDPRYLELYARYVEARSYDAGYLAEARRKVAIVTEAVRASVEKDGRLGACVDASGMIGRMLDRLGVWNYVAKSTLTIEFPVSSALSPRYFWAIDHGEFTAPHAVVVAPPYYIVDATVRYQAYDARRALLVPNVVLADEFLHDQWRPEDIANHELVNAIRNRRIKFSEFFARSYPDMSALLSQLPARKFVFNGVSLRYAIVAIGGTIDPLEKIVGYKPSGRTAQMIFNDDVAPLLASADESSR